jgi:triosephosphate isomerase (TIM)
MTRRPLIAGNWKMNGLRSDLAWMDALGAALEGGRPDCDLVLFPPATLIGAMMEPGQAQGVSIGGQDCAPAASGAHTGDISAEMLADLGCSHVIVGHSERRADHGETDAQVRAKAEAALRAGLTPIICIGETLDEREAGRAEAVVTAQLQASAPDAPAALVVIAYEPVWAIGTGRTASDADAQAMHAAIRASWRGGDAQALRILYVGSVKPDNAEGLLSKSDIDGALVGGASLDAQSFAGIARCVP